MSAVERAARQTVCGRDEELRELSCALAAARARGPRVVLVIGPAGVGKSALIRHFAAAQADVSVLWTAADSSERSIPFALADQLLRRAQSGGPGGSVLDADPDDFAAVGVSILEVLGQSAPLVVVVDDAQWADPPSLKSLLFAVRRLVGASVLVVMAIRTDALHVLPDGYLRLVGTPLTLGPLGFNAVRALVRSRGLSLSAHALRRLHKLSAGVPLHLCALLDEAPEDPARVPPTYAALTLGRLSECGEEARRLVEAAAVLNDGAAVDDVARVA